MPRKIINWGTDEEFIKKYEELKSSRKMGEFYNCDKTSVLNHAKKIGYDTKSNKQYKLSEEDKQIILQNYNIKTSVQLAKEFKVSRGMITKIWYDNNLIGKEIKSHITGNDLTNKTFGKWTVIEKTNKRASNGGVYWHCICECGNEKNILAQSLLNGRSLSCGEHSNISKGNSKIIEILNNNNIQYETEKKFNSCKDKRELPFDFYIENKYLIEYDGKQHFDKKSIFDYEYTHNHDLLKSKWCKENNIPLIRIPYTHYDNLCLEDLLLETSSFIEK